MDQSPIPDRGNQPYPRKVVSLVNPKEFDAAAKLTALPYPPFVGGICFGLGCGFFLPRWWAKWEAFVLSRAIHQPSIWLTHRECAKVPKIKLNCPDVSVCDTSGRAVSTRLIYALQINSLRLALGKRDQCQMCAGGKNIIYIHISKIYNIWEVHKFFN